MEDMRRAVRQLTFADDVYEELAKELDLRQDDTLPYPIGTDGRYLYFNSELIEEWTTPEIIGVIAHEIGHIIWRKVHMKTEIIEVFWIFEIRAATGVKEYRLMSCPAAVDEIKRAVTKQDNTQNAYHGSVYNDPEAAFSALQKLAQNNRKNYSRRGVTDQFFLKLGYTLAMQK